MKKSTRRATIRFLTGNTIGAASAAWISVRWINSTRHDAPFWAKVWLVLCAVSVLLGVFRILYYRNRRDYFAEEMDHRCLSAKDFQSFELKVKT
jgi:hypothetical protein